MYSPTNQVAALDPRSNSAQREESREIVRELDLAISQANILSGGVEELYGRLAVVIRPDTSVPENPGGVDGRAPEPQQAPQTQIGQRINAVTTSLQSISFIVRDILRRLELQ